MITQTATCVAQEPALEVSNASAELAQDLEQQVEDFAPIDDEQELKPVEEEEIAHDPAECVKQTIPPSILKKFRRGYGEHAAEIASQIKQLVVTSAEGILRKARLVFDMKLRLNRKEWGVWLREVLGWFGNEATPYLQIAKTFCDFEPAVFSTLEPFVILKLRTKRYVPVVVRLHEELVITSQLIQNFIKEVIPKQSRKKKTPANYGDAVMMQHPSAEDGTSYFTLNANLGEKAGSWLQQKLENYTVGQVLDHAAEWEQKVESGNHTTREGIEAEVEYRIRNRFEIREFALKQEIVELKAQLLQSATNSLGLVEKIPATTVSQETQASKTSDEIPATTVSDDAVASEPIESATGIQQSDDEVALAPEQASEYKYDPTEASDDYLEPISSDAGFQRKENVAQNLGAEHSVLKEGDLVQIDAISDRTWNGLTGYIQKVMTKTCKAVVLLQGDYRTKHFFLDEFKLVHEVEEDLSDAIQARAPQKELVEAYATNTIPQDVVASEPMKDFLATSIPYDAVAQELEESASTTTVTDEAVAPEPVESSTTTTIPQDAVAQEPVSSKSLPQPSDDSATSKQIKAADWDLIQELRAAESSLQKIDAKIQGLNSPLAQSGSNTVVERELKQLRSLHVSEIVDLINSNLIPAYYEELQGIGRVVLDPKYASDFLMQAQSWADVVLVSGSDRAQLIKAVKEWSFESKQTLVQLLSLHLEIEQSAFEQIDWIPKKLLGKALSPLSFTVQRIKKSDNLVDEPEIEYISGCHFNSLSNLGTRHEQWVFHFEGNLIPAFGRDEFLVEKF